MKSRFMFGHAQSVVGMVAPDHPFQRKSANFGRPGAVVPTNYCNYFIAREQFLLY